VPLLFILKLIFLLSGFNIFKYSFVKK